VVQPGGQADDLCPSNFCFRRARDLDSFRQSDKRNTGADGHGAALQRGENQAGRNLQAQQHSKLRHGRRVPAGPLAVDPRQVGLGRPSRLMGF
jgi:hypothetical protein